MTACVMGVVCPGDQFHCGLDSEWQCNIHRDSLASYIGHHGLMSYFALAEGITVGRCKYELLEVRAGPWGHSPELLCVLVEPLSTSACIDRVDRRPRRRSRPRLSWVQRSCWFQAV